VYRTVSATVDAAFTSSPDGARRDRSLVTANTIGPKMINAIRITHSHSTIHP